MPAGQPASPSHRAALSAGLRPLAAAAALALLWLAREVLLLGFLGVVLAVVFSFPVGWLSRVMSRGVAVLVVLLALLGVGAAFIAVQAPRVARQARELRQSAPRVLEDLRRRVELIQDQTGTGGSDEKGGGPAAPQQTAEKLARPAIAAAVGLASGLTTAVLVLVLALFLVYQPDAYRRGLRKLVPREHEEAFDEAWRRVRQRLRGWVGGIVVSMTIMGSLTAGALALVGIKQWLLLGILTFLGTFVPYIGAIATAIPGLIAGLAQSPRYFLLAGAVYVGVHVVEGYIVEPFVMRRAVDVKPALLLFAQGLSGAAFGILGTVVSTPLLVCAKELVDYLWVERRLGKDPST